MRSMASWRDTTPQQVQDDLDGVVSTALDVALSLLTKNGEFFPFGITIGDEGDIAMAAADPSLGERPDSTAVLDGLYSGVQGDHGAYRAAGFVADVRANGGDAVRVEAEHRDGGSPLVVVMPYARKGLVKKTVTYGQMTAGAGQRRIWPEG